ncbi:unnamed protein product [Urochloa decumbens]|uniref:Small auxin up regulated protein n=1 Tax=Urochloa decumbens TaxID=240449 RepID=A0ABC9FV30_9POAL
MINTKRISQVAKKWQRMAALGRKRLALKSSKEAEKCSTSVAGKGHCVIYTAEGRRFEVPLVYLGTTVFSELLRMSQEEFGFTSDDGRIILPCDSTVMEYILCMLRNASTDVENAFMISMIIPCYYTSRVAPSLGLISQLAVFSY